MVTARIGSELGSIVVPPMGGGAVIPSRGQTASANRVTTKSHWVFARVPSNADDDPPGPKTTTRPSCVTRTSSEGLVTRVTIARGEANRLSAPPSGQTG